MRKNSIIDSICRSSDSAIEIYIISIHMEFCRITRPLRMASVNENNEHL